MCENSYTTCDIRPPSSLVIESDVCYSRVRVRRFVSTFPVLASRLTQFCSKPANHRISSYRTQPSSCGPHDIGSFFFSSYTRCSCLVAGRMHFVVTAVAAVGFSSTAATARSGLRQPGTTSDNNNKKMMIFKNQERRRRQQRPRATAIGNKGNTIGPSTWVTGRLFLRRVII